MLYSAPLGRQTFYLFIYFVANFVVYLGSALLYRLKIVLYKSKALDIEALPCSGITLVIALVSARSAHVRVKQCSMTARSGSTALNFISLSLIPGTIEV